MSRHRMEAAEGLVLRHDFPFCDRSRLDEGFFGGNIGF